MSGIDGGDKVKIAAGEDLGTGTWALDNFHLSFSTQKLTQGQKPSSSGLMGAAFDRFPRWETRPGLRYWSPDQKSVYVSAVKTAEPLFSIWKWDVDVSNPEKLVDKCCLMSDAEPGGKYLLGSILFGEKIGIYEVSIFEKKCIPLLPGVITFGATFAP